MSWQHVSVDQLCLDTNIYAGRHICLSGCSGVEAWWAVEPCAAKILHLGNGAGIKWSTSPLVLARMIR